MPGLLRGMARTAVVAGTATAVSNRVSRRQAARWGEQQQEYVPAYMAPTQAQPEPAYAPPPPAAAAEPSMDTKIEELQKLAQLKEQGILTEQEFGAQKARILGG
jgi:hypothetical protein